MITLNFDSLSQILIPLLGNLVLFLTQLDVQNWTAIKKIIYLYTLYQKENIVVNPIPLDRLRSGVCNLLMLFKGCVELSHIARVDMCFLLVNVILPSQAVF